MKLLLSLLFIFILILFADTQFLSNTNLNSLIDNFCHKRIDGKGKQWSLLQTQQNGGFATITFDLLDLQNITYATNLQFFTINQVVSVSFTMQTAINSPETVITLFDSQSLVFQKNYTNSEFKYFVYITFNQQAQFTSGSVETNLFQIPNLTFNITRPFVTLFQQDIQLT